MDKKMKLERKKRRRNGGKRRSRIKRKWINRRIRNKRRINRKTGVKEEEETKVIGKAIVEEKQKNEDKPVVRKSRE